MDVEKIKMTLREAAFEKNPGRWAATPKFRLQLHKELEAKLAKIADYEPTRPRLVSGTAKGCGQAIVVAGVAAANARDIIKERHLDIPVYQVVQPFPLHREFIKEMDTYDEILVLEETWGVIEMQLADKNRVKGKNTGFISPAGELLPENVEERICAFAGLDYQAPQITMLPGRRPSYNFV